MISKKRHCGIKEFDKFEMLFYVTYTILNFKEVLLSRVHLFL